MCNRFRSPKDISRLPTFFAKGDRINFEFNPNVAPTEMVPAFLVEKDAERVARLARFGIPLNRPKPVPMMNTRTDSLRKGSFKSLLSGKRCVVPADGFYEWREEDGKKMPYLFSRADTQPILFAAIWDYSDIKGDQIACFSILTDEPNALMAEYHDRMPLILNDPSDWLDFAPLDDIVGIGPDDLAVRPVNPAVNKVSCKDLSAIEAPLPPKTASLF